MSDVRRYEELDSLRGVAALTVVFCHFLLILPSFAAALFPEQGATTDNWWLSALKYSPLHIFWGGHEAVLLFFVLSGFVLTLPYFNGQKMNYSSFIVKRVCRIYLPYFIAVLVSFAAAVTFYNGGITGLSSWFNMRWSEELTLTKILAYLSLILIPSYSSNQYNPALWTLVHEMRISLIFPLILVLVKRFSWYKSILIGVGISLFGFFGKIYIPGDLLLKDFVFTFQYVLMFIVGSLLAKHRAMLQQKFASLRDSRLLLLLIFGLLCYSYTWWFLHGVTLLHLEIINDFVITIGAAILILFAIFSRTFSRLLRVKPISFLGKISYSLYLYHSIALLSLVHLLHGSFPLWVVLICSFAVSCVLSIVAYTFIELPSIRLGRRLAGHKVNKRQVTNGTSSY